MNTDPIETISSPNSFDEPITESPYKELEFFSESDAERFAGRERDIQQVVSLIAAGRAIVLYGRSGLGKTSLLLAGVFPELRRLGYKPIYARILEAPIEDLARAVARECGLQEKNGGYDLKSILSAAESNYPLVLVIDQFEELFIRFKNSPRERAIFVREVSKIIAHESGNLRVLFSLREDYLAALDSFQEKVPGLFAHAHRLAPLSAFGAREAIVRPLERNGIPYKEQVVIRLLDELAKFDFDTARLQISCAELFRISKARHSDQPIITEEDLEALAGELRDHKTDTSVLSQPVNKPLETEDALLSGVFKRYLSEAIAPIEANHLLLARTALDAMITKEETKYAISFEELSEMVSGSESDLTKVLRQLVARRVVRPELRSRKWWYELMHECLVPEIRRWLEADEEFRMFRAARETILTGCRGTLWRRQPVWLLPEESLREVVQRFRNRLRLGEKELEFVVRSSIHRRTPDVGFWLEKFGREKSCFLLRELIENENAEVRRGAVAAVAAVKDPPNDLVERCLAIAINIDESATVRRSSGRSFVAAASDIDIRTLCSLLRPWWRTPRPMLDLLADLHDAGRTRKNLPLFWQLRARSEATRRLKKEHADEIRAATKSAMRNGAIAGLAWPLTCGLLFSAWFDFVVDPYPSVPWYYRFATYLGGAIPIGISLGALSGRIIGRAAARDSLQCNKERWFFVIAPWGVVATLLIVTLCGVGLYLTGTIFQISTQNTALVLIVALTGCALPLALAALAKIVRPCFRPALSPANTLIWTALVSVGLNTVALFIPAALFAWFTHHALRRFTQSWYSVSLVILAASILLNFFLFVAIYTLSQLEIAQLDQAPSKRERIGRRSWIVGFAILAIVAFLIAYGLHATPWLPETALVLPNNTWSAQAGLNLLPETHYFHLYLGNLPPYLIRLEAPPHTRLIVNNQEMDRETVNVLTSTGELDVAISNLPQIESAPYFRTSGIFRASIIHFLDELPQDWTIADPGTYLHCKLKAQTKTVSASNDIADQRLAPPPPVKPQSGSLEWRAELQGKWPKGVELTHMRVFLLETPALDNGLKPGKYSFKRDVIDKASDANSSQLYVYQQTGEPREIWDDTDRRLSMITRRREDNTWQAYFSLYPFTGTPDTEQSKGTERAEVIVGFSLPSVSDLMEQVDRLPDEESSEQVDLAMDAYKLRPNDWWILRWLVNIMARDSRRADAIAIAQKALQQDPGNPFLLMICSEALAKNEQIAEALRFARQAAERDGNDRVVLENLILRLCDSGQYDEALRTAKKAYPNVPPEDLPGLWAFVSALAYSGKTKEAVDLARGQVTKHPSDAGFLWILSFALERDKSAPGALEAAKEAVQAAPGRLWLKRTLVIRLIEAGNAIEAVEEAMDLIDRTPKDPLAIYALAAALNATGSRFNDAYDWATKGVDRFPTWSSMHDELAQAAYGLGRWDVAVREWSEALKLDQNEFEETAGLPYWGERARNFEYAKQKVAE